MSLLGGGFCSTKGMKSACLDDGYDTADGSLESMAFVGNRRGDYIQELNYRYVGDGAGEFEMVSAPKKPRSNQCWFICMASAITLVVGVLFWGLVIEQPAGRETSTTVPPSAAASPVHNSLECDVQELHTGGKVEAAYSISFMPAGRLEAGTPGTIVAVLPSDNDGGHSVVIDWEGHPDLQGARVSRSQIQQAISPGDRVEALARITPVTPHSSNPGDPGQLEGDDLLLATTDIDGRIPRGTFGYVADILSVGEHKYVVDFPEFPQFANSRVRADEVVKAPLVADRVHAVEDIDYGTAGTIPVGTAGTVATMTRERTTYSYVVEWDGFPDFQRLNVNGLKLKVASDSSAPSVPVIPQGAQGRVVATTRSADGGVSFVLVDWDGFPNAGPANVSRVRVTKTPDWSKEHRDHCCRDQGAGCLPTTTNGQVELYNCQTPGEWSEKKSQWCCKWKAMRCHTASSSDKHHEGGSKLEAHPLFNCSTTEKWPEDKKKYCCEAQNIGCGVKGLRGSAPASSPPGWTSLASSGCVEGSSLASATALALDRARSQLLQEDPKHCAFVVVADGEGQLCAGSVQPQFSVEASESIQVYHDTLTAPAALSVGAGTGRCWRLTHRGCSVNATDAAGCTHWLFTEPPVLAPAPAPAQLFG